MDMIFTLLLFVHTAHGAECTQWKAPEKIADLDKVALKEVSALEFSSKYHRFYFANDSGNGPYFFYSAESSPAALKQVQVSNWSPLDQEDMSIGGCGTEKDANSSCLWLADIGDNFKIRPYLEVALIEEQDTIADQVTAFRKIILRYPDRSHDAESFAVHPNGDLYLITKEESLGRPKRVLPSIIFRLPYARWKDRTRSDSFMLERVTTVDFARINQDSGNYYAGLPSAMDIASDGSHFFILNYFNAVVFGSEWGSPTKVPLIKLPRQESLALLGDDRSFVYTTEFSPELDRSQTSIPLMKVECR